MVGRGEEESDDLRQRLCRQQMGDREALQAVGDEDRGSSSACGRLACDGGLVVVNPRIADAGHHHVMHAPSATLTHPPVNRLDASRSGALRC
jgi:hypothetical protein